MERKEEIEMKKIFALALAALTMTACLTGCGKKDAAASDYEYLKEKGTMIVGMTEYEPMDFKDENGEWMGFDAELGKMVAEKLGVKAEFMVLPDWGQKFAELDTKNIDVIWNGMTITDEVKNNTSYTKPYLMNAQVVVMNKDKAADYADKESLKGLKFAIENGSAGQACLDDLGITDYAALQDQPAAIQEVKAGTSDACVVDISMANAMIKDGTDFADLTIAQTLTEEQFGIAFRKGSDLTEKVNTILDELTADGTMQTLADKYNLTLAK